MRHLAFLRDRLKLLRLPRETCKRRHQLTQPGSTAHRPSNTIFRDHSTALPPLPQSTQLLNTARPPSNTIIRIHSIALRPQWHHPLPLIIAQLNIARQPRPTIILTRSTALRQRLLLRCQSIAQLSTALRRRLTTILTRSIAHLQPRLSVTVLPNIVHQQRHTTSRILSTAHLPRPLHQSQILWPVPQSIAQLNIAAPTEPTTTRCHSFALVKFQALWTVWLDL